MSLDAERTIALLPPDVANQIAAGEVVERPASIVKELVENALDANARTVTVSIDGGGIERLVVTDDGDGMSSDDLSMSVVRHATSKIRRAEDLIGVATYGFRGEALPSIASVSRATFVSRRRDRNEGAEMRVEAGGAPTLRAIGCAPGTSVTVEDLFFNTPARRKFLRTANTESAACIDTVVRLALPRPDVRFVVRRDGKVVRELLRHNDVATRARDVFGGESVAEMHGERGGLRVTALLGAPERARSGTQSLALYVNGRAVRDKVLLRAVAQAYGSTLEGGRYPVGALLLEVPPNDVDVNVHPQKSEVRFAAQNEVFAAITSVIREGLARAPWARVHAAGELGEGRLEGPRPDAIASTSESPAIARAFGAFVVPDGAEPDPWGLRPQPPYPPVAYSTAAAQLTSSPTSDALISHGEFGALRFVAQLRRTFLLCEGERGMVILDQHAAAERVTFERLKKAYGSREVSMQPLLVPEQVEVSAREAALADDCSAELSSLGFELHRHGDALVTVRAVPALMHRADPRRLARDVLAELSRAGNDFSRSVDLVLATMACHGSVRAGDELADAEARALLASLDRVAFAGHCPHGRPVVWSVPWSELERRVGR